MFLKNDYMNAVLLKCRVNGFFSICSVSSRILDLPPLIRGGGKPDFQKSGGQTPPKPPIFFRAPSARENLSPLIRGGKPDSHESGGANPPLPPLLGGVEETLNPSPFRTICVKFLQ